MKDNSNHIISLLLKKDEQAIDLIYQHYSANMYGYILKIVQDEQLAQDILQESFVKIWKNSDRYDFKKARLFTLILNICRNLAIDKLRARKRYLTDDNQSIRTDVHNYSITQLNVDQIDLREKVDTLEIKYKQIIEVLFFRGMTQREASEYLKLPLGTVKTRFKIALRELKKIFDQNKNDIGILLGIVWMIR